MKENILQMERKKCLGCGICVSICPEQAIEMRQISEGFFYPFVDEYCCKGCGECSEHCPGLNKKLREERNIIKAYAFAASDEIRWNQADGGAVWIAMKEILSMGGKVCAPFFSSDFRTVNYKIIECLDELESHTLSFCLDSNATKLYTILKELLDENNLVLFLGTPCNVTGVKGFLEKDYDNLLTGEIVCKGVTSQEIWKSYLTYVCGGDSVKEIKLGAKEIGWRPSIRIKYGVNKSDENIIYEGTENEPFLQAYKKGLILRKNCENCEYHDLQGDFQFGNFYNIENYKKNINDKKGISYIACCSPKAIKFMETFQKDAKILEMVPNDAIPDQKDMVCSWEERTQFFMQWEVFGWRNFTCTLPPQKITAMSSMVLDYHVGDEKKWIIANKKVWQEKKINGHIVMFSDGYSKHSGIQMLLDRELEADVKYQFDIRFKASTDIRRVRFYLTNKRLGEQGCVSEVIWERNIPNNSWIRVQWNSVFSKGGWQFFCTTDFRGEGSYACFDWIRIREVCDK